MAEYIDKQRLYGYLCDTLAINCSRNRVLNLIYDWPPTADVVEVVHGLWKNSDFIKGMLTCTKCGAQRNPNFKIGGGAWNFCPNCGADMRAEPAENSKKLESHSKATRTPEKEIPT